MAGLNILRADQPIHCKYFHFDNLAIGIKEEIIGKWTFTVSEKFTVPNIHEIDSVCTHKAPNRYIHHSFFNSYIDFNFSKGMLILTCSIRFWVCSSTILLSSIKILTCPIISLVGWMWFWLLLGYLCWREPCMFASFRTLTKRRTRLTRAPRATSSEADVSGLGQLAIEIFTSDWLLLAVSSRGNDLAVVLRRLG